MNAAAEMGLEKNKRGRLRGDGNRELGREE